LVPGILGSSDSSRRPPSTERGGFVLNLPGPNRDQERAPSRGGQVRGKHPHEERSAGQYRSHSVADLTAPYGNYHDPVCRAAAGRRRGSGVDLEPLISFASFRAFAAMVSER
jgi:hypothetical protein